MHLHKDFSIDDDDDNIMILILMIPPYFIQRDGHFWSLSQSLRRMFSLLHDDDEFDDDETEAFAIMKSGYMTRQQSCFLYI